MAETGKSPVVAAPQGARSAGVPLKFAGGLPPVRSEGSAAVEVLRAAAPQSLARILRPQAAQRWLLPQLTAITPAYIESVLRGGMMGGHIQAWELFDLMEDTWPELASCAQELKNAVMRKRAIFEPFHDEDEEPSTEAIEKQKLVSAALRQMNPQAAADENGLTGLQFDILDAWFKGLAVQEIDWTNGLGDGEMNIIRAGKLGDITAPRATFFIHPQHYAWGVDGKLGLRLPDSGRAQAPSWQPSATEVAPFPPHKFIIAIHKAKSGSAQIGALLRPLAWWWCAANFSADWLMNLAQVFGLPFRWANYAQGSAQATVDSICSMLENMGSNAWAAFPEGTTLELKEASKSGDNSPQGDLLDRANSQARQLILGQTMAGNNARSGAGNGAGAFGKQEGDVKADIIEAAGDFVCEVINKQVIPAIIEINYGEADECPLMRFVEEENEKELVENFGIAVRAGLLTPSRDDEEAIRKRLNLPAMSKDVEREWKKQGGARSPITIQDETHPAGSGFGRVPGAPAPASVPAPDDKAKTGKENEPAEEEEKEALKAAAPRDPQSSADLAAILVRRLGPLVQHAQAIAKIQNPILRAAMFEDFFADQPAVLRALKADPTIAQAIEALTGEAFLKGVKQS